MQSHTFAQSFAFLMALCCLAPMAALGAILFLQALVAPTALAALLIVILLARRLFALLATSETDEPRSPSNFSPEEGLLSHDHRQH